MRRSLLLLLPFLALAAGPAAPQGDGRRFAVEGDCGGRPATLVRMADGYCLGLVWQRSDDGPRMPRDLLQLPDGDWLVTELGNWTEGRGAVWRMSPAADGTVAWTRLIGGLTMPHTLAFGPEGADGPVYVGEMSRIFAFDPAAPDAQTTVISGLPDNRLHENRHPLSAFIFDADGALLVNVGAPSDQCLDADGAPLTDEAGQCRELADQAQIRRYAPLGEGRWSADWTVYASGLRNSMAMARHASGAVYQAENSIDLSDPALPYEEINRLDPGAHYGWPYCTGMNMPRPGWPENVAQCGARAAPVSLMPPHAAPLAMTYYDGPMFPELQGRMLMSWHGFRPTGGRIVAIDTDGEGAPLTVRPAYYAVYPRGAARYPEDAPAPRAVVLTAGWSAQPGRHPMGSPAGIRVADDGSIWIADDRNGAILRIARP